MVACLLGVTVISPCYPQSALLLTRSLPHADSRVA